MLQGQQKNTVCARRENVSQFGGKSPFVSFHVFLQILRKPPSLQKYFISFHSSDLQMYVSTEQATLRIRYTDISLG